MKEKNKSNFKFSSVDVQSFNPTLAVEKCINGRDYVSWGDKNDYPDYLYDTVSNCATLQSVINGSIDYTCGNRININPSILDTDFKLINKKGDHLKDIIYKTIVDRWIFGGFFLQLVFNKFGRIIEIIHIDPRLMRTNLDESEFYMTEKWGRFTNTSLKKFKPFNPDTAAEDGIQMYYFKNKNSRGVYPVPDYKSSLVSAEIQIQIQNFHINSINNNFSPSAIINFNNGDIDDDTKKLVEKAFNDKFCGVENAARFFLSFNNSKDNEITLQRLASDDFDERYNALYTSSMENIFISMRALPVLFGLVINSGFNEQEFLEAFTLYNKTACYPKQLEQTECYDEIFEIKDSITFDTFTLNPEKDITTDAENIPENILPDLTLNERRNLIGYPDIQEEDANKSILADRLGVGGTEALVSVVSNTEINSDAKRGILSVLFGLNDDEINKIIP